MEFWSGNNQKKVTEGYFSVLLFIMLYKVFLTFKSVEKTLVCNHSNEATEQYFYVVLFIMTVVHGWSNC